MLIVRLHGQIGPNGLVPSPMGQSRGSFCKVSPLHKHTAAVLKCAQLWCLRYRNGFRIYGQGQSRTCEKNSIYQPRLYHSIFKKKTFHVPWRPLWWKSLTFLRKWLRCTGPGFQRVVIRNRGRRIAAFTICQWSIEGAMPIIVEEFRPIIVGAIIAAWFPAFMGKTKLDMKAMQCESPLT